jgi:hypothetical protein
MTGEVHKKGLPIDLFIMSKLLGHYLENNEGTGNGTIAIKVETVEAIAVFLNKAGEEILKLERNVKDLIKESDYRYSSYPSIDRDSGYDDYRWYSDRSLSIEMQGGFCDNLGTD